MDGSLFSFSHGNIFEDFQIMPQLEASFQNFLAKGNQKNTWNFKLHVPLHFTTKYEKAVYNHGIADAVKAQQQNNF